MRNLQKDRVGAVVRIGSDQAKTFAKCGSEMAGQDRNADLVYWPSKNAPGAQQVEVGVPFVRNKVYPNGTKEVLVVERTRNGALTSRCVGTVAADRC